MKSSSLRHCAVSYLIRILCTYSTTYARGLIDLGTYSSDQATDVAGISGGSVTVDCPAGTQYYIMIDEGNNQLAGPVRSLTGVTNVLPYDLRNNGGAVVGDSIAALPAHVGVSYGAMTFNAQPITGVIAGGVQNYPLTVDLLFSNAATLLTAAESVTDQPVVAVVW